MLQLIVYTFAFTQPVVQGRSVKKTKNVAVVCEHSRRCTLAECGLRRPLSFLTLPGGSAPPHELARFSVLTPAVQFERCGRGLIQLWVSVPDAALGLRQRSTEPVPGLASCKRCDGRAATDHIAQTFVAYTI